MLNLDREFLRLCPIVIATPRGKRPSPADAALIKRSLPMWTAGYVTERATADNIGRAVLTIMLTDAGRAELSRR